MVTPVQGYSSDIVGNCTIVLPVVRIVQSFTLKNIDTCFFSSHFYSNLTLFA